MLQFISTFESVIFSSELKEVLFSSDSDVTLTFSIAGVDVFTNIYTPDSSRNIRVYALDEIYNTMRPSAVSSVAIRLQNTSGDQISAQFNCIQCTALINATAEFYLDRYFIIGTCSDYRHTAPGRDEKFWVYQTDVARTLTRKAYYIDANNAMTSVSYTYPSQIQPNTLQEISFNTDDLQVSGKSLYKVEFSDGLRKLVYEVDTRRDIDSVHFRYQNIFGLLDDIYYFGLKETELSSELETGQLNGKWVNTKAKAYPSVKVHSGYISRTEIYPYIAFISSSERYLVDENGYARTVALTEQETKYSNSNSDLIDFTVTFRREKDALVIGVSDNRIFDQTFDMTFN